MKSLKQLCVLLLVVLTACASWQSATAADANAGASSSLPPATPQVMCVLQQQCLCLAFEKNAPGQGGTERQLAFVCVDIYLGIWHLSWVQRMPDLSAARSVL